MAHKRNSVVADILKRTKYGKFQSSLTIEKRLENVTDAFRLKIDNKVDYTDKHIVIVDDLMTTGSTIVQAAKALIPLKPASVTAIVVARAI